MRLFLLVIFAAAVAAGRDVRITVLATTDLHANIYPWDYLTGQPAPRGLASLATLIQAERKANPNTMLIDVGDTVQGTPLASLWQTWMRTGTLPHDLRWAGQAPSVNPMMLVMNHLRYDSMTVGNHEFNHGLESLDKTCASARFPWLSANTVASSGRRAFDPYIVRTVAGVKIAILGLTTPSVPAWENPENIEGYAFGSPIQAARKALAELRASHKPDVVIAAVHAGLERDLKSGAVRPTDNPEENVVHALASRVEGIDAIVFGHTHQALAKGRIGDVLLMQPKNWGMSLGALDLTLTDANGHWTLRSKSSRLIPVTKETVPDPEVLRLAKPYHEATERYLNVAVSSAPASVDATRSRIEDNALIDAIHTVQLHYGKADVSLAAAFNPRVRVAKGPVTVRQLAALYLYENELYTLAGTGRVLREALENAVRVYTQCATPDCESGVALDRSIPGYNLDFAQGVTYEVDLTEPPGCRIKNLRFQGEALRDDRPLKIATNDYRAGGSGGYKMLRGLPVVWRSYEDIREMMIRYFSSRPLPAAPDGNWKIVPEAARRSLAQQAERDAQVGATQ